MVRRFLEVEAAMYQIAGVVDPGEPTERYERYRAWSAFVGQGRSFVEAASRELGMDPELLYENPSQIRF